MRYSLAIFDLDGTVLDTLSDLADSVNAALAATGYPLRTLDEVRSFVGNGIRKLMERIVPAGTAESEIDRVHAAFTAHYTQHCADKTCPYEGILPLLATLRQAGVKIAVLSNKADYATQALCAKYFPNTFHLVAGEREKDGIPKKPAPDAVYDLMRQCGVTADETVYIGDSEVDVETAQNADIDSILVTWGFRSEETLRAAGARTVVDTPALVQSIILA